VIAAPATPAPAVMPVPETKPGEPKKEEPKKNEVSIQLPCVPQPMASSLPSGKN
jgi:hypothetical protein